MTLDPILTATAVIIAAIVLVTHLRNPTRPRGTIAPADNGEPLERL
jgi:hypothetical protein